ncbi:MAG: polysaccharide deacetylase family protein [Sodalinema sp.]|uniref:polysaccharide deacetylase family protein n=1 Tax=Sodalinema sp. TaxID=3080550 RepID=UPI00122891C1|nr:MAG: polysaccharide deacetylase family protein [Phormidium sp. SL48-SHIP]
MMFAPLYPYLYRVLAPIFPDCLWSAKPTQPQVALTFDDGPHPQYTPPLLDVLDQLGVTASFFWLGASVRRYPEIARAVFERGHWLGLHGDTHRAFPRLSSRGLQMSLEATQGAIANACDRPLDWVKAQVRDVRPPNGLFTPKTLHLLQSWQYRPVMWSVVPEDWRRPGVQRVCDRVMKQVKPGSLIVLHDGCYGGQDVAQTTLTIVEQLQSKNYQFVNIQQLWHLKSGVQSG